MDDEWILIVPFGTVILFVLGAILCGAGLVYEIQQWFYSNLKFVITIMTVLTIIGGIILFAVSRRISVALTYLLATTQTVFFAIYGGVNLPVENGGWSVIWSMIVFILYVIYGIANIIVTYGGSFFFGCHKKSDTEGAITVNLIICGVGWFLNLAIFVLLPLFFA